MSNSPMRANPGLYACFVVQKKELEREIRDVFSAFTVCEAAVLSENCPALSFIQEEASNPSPELLGVKKTKGRRNLQKPAEMLRESLRRSGFPVVNGGGDAAVRTALSHLVRKLEQRNCKGIAFFESVQQ
mmetsp:Transcript_26035/g.28961  ORF Transcript_26035/g.28961 Transcript_26035/m.28961 type:complete len:130 (-) Transcript_26035:521-910(-)